MGERKGVNKYYPPDYNPEKGGLNKFLGTHALRERARKLHEGILIIRFEMPYNIWCNGCGNHIGMGVRYNAQKRKMGYYYTTPIYKFRMKCHLCDQHFEIQTDPQNCDYVILSGARRKEERWDTEKAGNVQSTDREVKEKLMTDAMYKLEHDAGDKQKARKVAPTLSRLEDIREAWKDDFALNQFMRKKFRDEKKEIADKKMADDQVKAKASLPEDFTLVNEQEADIEISKVMRYGDADVRPDLLSRQRKRDIKRSSIFDAKTSSKVALARSLAGKARQKNGANNRVDVSLSPFSPRCLGVKVRRKSCPSDGQADLSLSSPDISKDRGRDSVEDPEPFTKGTDSSSSWLSAEQEDGVREPSWRALSNDTPSVQPLHREDHGELTDTSGVGSSVADASNARTPLEVHDGISNNAELTGLNKNPCVEDPSRVVSELDVASDSDWVREIRESGRLSSIASLHQYSSCSSSSDEGTGN